VSEVKCMKFRRCGGFRNSPAILEIDSDLSDCLHLTFFSILSRSWIERIILVSYLTNTSDRWNVVLFVPSEILNNAEVFLGVIVNVSKDFILLGHISKEFLKRFWLLRVRHRYKNLNRIIWSKCLHFTVLHEAGEF